jgi:HEPN domain-containing protein
VSGNIRASKDIVALKNNIIRDLFVRTADENYISARWCAVNHLNYDFLWLAVHCLEKYFKSVLLSNGHSSKNYGHDITKLFDETRKLVGNLLPSRLEKPDKLSIQRWIEWDLEKFIKYLYSNGNSENRYAIYGYITNAQDLHMLDSLVFSIRRLICQLDDRWHDVEHSGVPKFTHRDLLTK